MTGIVLADLDRVSAFPRGHVRDPLVRWAFRGGRPAPPGRDDGALAFERGIEGRPPQVDELAERPSFGTSEEDDPEGTEIARRTSRQHPDHDKMEWPPQ